MLTSRSFNAVRHLYFAGHIFHEFHELAFIHEINFQRKLIHRHVICIFTYFVRPVHKMALQVQCTSRRFPVHSQFLKVLSRVVCRWETLLNQIAKCRDWFTKTQGWTVRPWTRLEVHMLVSPQRKAFLPPSWVNAYPGAMVPCGWWCQNAWLWRCEYYATCPHPYTSSYSFRENIFCKIEFATELWNI